jgi:hypothetical protein
MTKGIKEAKDGVERHKQCCSGAEEYRSIYGHGAIVEITPKSLAQAQGFDLAVTEPDELGLSLRPLSSELGQCDDLLGFAGKFCFAGAIIDKNSGCG